MISPADRLGAWGRSARAITVDGLLLRLGAGVLGLLGLVLATRHWSGAAVALVVVGGLGVLVTLGWPDGLGPLTALAAMGAAWLLSYGWTGEPPVLRTAVLGGLGYLFHTTATLSAAVPASSRLDLRLLSRWGGHVALSLIGAAAVTAVGYAVGRLGGSLTLELVGLVGVVLVVAVPVWLVRGRD